MFYDKFVAICRDRGVTPTAVLRAIGVSPGSLGNWKIGSDPRMATKEKIAEYFNVSVKELMYYGEEDEKAAGDNKEKKSEANNDLELDKYSRALLELYQLLPEDNSRISVSGCIFFHFFNANRFNTIPNSPQ